MQSFCVSVCIFLFLLLSPCFSDAADVSVKMPLDETRGAAPAGTPEAASSGLAVLGGPGREVYMAKPSETLLRRVIVEPADLKAAALVINIVRADGNLKGAALTFHRLLVENPASRPATGADYEAAPFASYRFGDRVAPGTIRIPGFEDYLCRLVSGKERTPFFAAVLTPAGEAKGELQIVGALRAFARYHGKEPQFELTLEKRESFFVFDEPVKPVEGVYAVAKGSRIFYGDKPLKLWGVARHDSKYLETAARLRKMGFNAIRLWGPRGAYDTDSARRGEMRAVQKGDGSSLDQFDRFFAEIKRQGMWVLSPSLHYDVCGVYKVPEGVLADDSFVAGGPDWPEWKKAFSAAGLRLEWLKYFDERFRKLCFKNAENFLNHVNPYTAKRYAEEEAIACWENDNENGFLKWVLEQGFGKWQPHFKKELQEKWNAWLRGRYGDGAGLAKAWGKLEPGESLEQSGVALAPIYNERTRFPQKRGDDFVRFLAGLVDDYNQAFREHCRRQAPKGVGVNVTPFLFDTQFRNNIPWLYADSRADVNSFGIYQWALTSSLTVPPALYVVDSNTVAGRPSVLYEVNISRPDPYRAEFPARLAALGDWQDFSGIFWHYWNEAGWPADPELADEQYLIDPLPIVRKGWGDGGIYHATDPVMCSSFALAGRLFLANGASPASNPTTYALGPNGIFSYSNFNGIDVRATTFERGSRIAFDLEQTEALRVIGQEAPKRAEGAVRAGEILWDWPNGRMIIDSPTFKAYVGVTAESFRFADGITVSGFSSPFVTFMLSSADGKPLLDGCRKAYLTAVFDARNTGFEFDWSIARAGGGFVAPDEMAAAVKNEGRAPYLVDRVDFTLSLPKIAEMTVTDFDFALRKVAERKISGTNTVDFERGEPPFVTVLQIESLGATAEPAVKKRDVVPHPSMTGAKAAEKSAAPAAVRALWLPIAGMDWTMDYFAAHQFLRDSSFTYSSISPLESNQSAKKKILFSGTNAVLSTIADVELTFEDGRMRAARVSFAKPPLFEEGVKELTAKLGAPAELKKASEAWATNLARWSVSRQGSTLDVRFTEYQGSVSLEAALK